MNSSYKQVNELAVNFFLNMKLKLINKAREKMKDRISKNDFIFRYSIFYNVLKRVRKILKKYKLH